MRDWLIARFWHNGGKLTLVVLAMGVVAAAVSASTVWQILDKEPLAPLEVRTPFEVTLSPIAEGGNLVMLTDFCNDSDDVIEVFYAGAYIQIGPEGLPVQRVDGNEDSTAVLPGCNVAPFIVPLPPDVTPGYWYRTSERAYRYQGHDYRLSTRTEVFEVVPRAQ